MPSEIEQSSSDKRVCRLREIAYDLGSLPAKLFVVHIIPLMLRD